MAAQIGIVKALIGTATATAADGTIRNLQIGGQVFADELITTGVGGAIELEFADGSLMDLGRNSQAVLDDAVFNPEAATAVAETTDAEVDAIQAALLAGEDPTQVGQATAAGAGVEGGNEGSSTVQVIYEAPEVTPTSGFDTVGITNEFDEIEEEQLGDTLTATVTLNDVIVNEGEGTATITATLDTAVTGSPLVITLSNGATITILVGGTTGESTPFEIQGDDPYIDGESFDVSITGTSGGNFASVDTSDTATVTVEDTIDTTVISLEDVTVFEGGSVSLGDEGLGQGQGDFPLGQGGSSVTITATVSNPVTNSPLVITLDNGATITIPVGETEGVSTPFEIQGDDVYVDGENFDVSIASTTGGNYEDLDTSSTATVTITDTIDTTTVILNDVNVAEDSTITYTASVDNAPQGAFSVTLNNGVVINFADGSLTGSSAAQAAQGDDVYVDADSFPINIASTSGGNYEDLDTTDTATVTITDTSDIVTATLTTSATEISEDGGNITYTVTLTGTPGDIDPDTNLVFTLANGDEVTILAGQTSGSVISVYADGDITDQASIANSITDVTSGGSEYEELVTTGTTNVDVSYAPVAVAAEGNGLEDSTGIEVTLSATDPDANGTIVNFVIQSLPENGTLFIGATQVTAGMSIDATGGSATVTFVPDADWSDNNGDGPVTFDYVAVDNDGVESAEATATVNVTPVTDTPTVALTLTQVTNSSLYAADLSNVLNDLNGQVGNPPGFTVTALKAEGDNWVETEISVKDTGSPTGFGVAGNGGSNGADSELENGEKLFIELDAPAASVTFQLAWLNSTNETAEYTLTYDNGTTQTFVITGGSDQVDPPVTIDAPEGQTITAIEFATPNEGNRVATSDYLVHTVSYVAASTTYSVDITATPTDTDFSESITQLIVTTPEGVTLSDSQLLSTEGGVSTWELLVDVDGTDNDYTGPTVQVNETTGVVTVGGLTLTVPADYEGPLTVTATATAYDPDAATADGSDSETVTISQEPDNDVSITVSGDAVTVDEDDLPEGSDTDKESTTQEGTFTISAPDGVASLTVAGAEVFSNGGFVGAIITTGLGNTLSITDYNADTGVVNYTYTLNDNEAHATAQGENSLSEVFAVRLEDTDGDVATDSLTVMIIDDVTTAVDDVASATMTSDGVTPVDGNVLTNDAQGADGAVVTSVSFNGSNVQVAASGTTSVAGTYGTLTIQSNGEYTYQPLASVQQVISLTQTGVLAAYGDNVNPITANGLDLNAAANALVDTHNATGGSSSKVGYGVDDSQGPTTIDAGETMLVDLGGEINGAFTFSIGEANANQTGNSGITWFAFDSEGNLVESGAVGGSQLNSDGTYTSGPLTLSDGVQYLAFQYEGNGNSSGYTLTDVSVEPPRGTDAFTYTITDGDGDTSQAMLTLTTDENVTGGAGDDNLLTGDGNDILIGGAGNDLLVGGAGADTFIWNDADLGTVGSPAHDIVQDFDINEDVLNLSDLLSDESYSIEGIEVGVAGSEHLQLNIKDSGGNVVQEIELSGVTVSPSPVDMLTTLLTSGAINDGL